MRVKFLAAGRTDVSRGSADPRVVDVLVVHADDVVTALAATAQGRETVLRVTPPFRPRQRARIHVPGGDFSGEDDSRSEHSASDQDAAGTPLLVPPSAFLDADAPSFPRAPDTEPAPADSPSYDVDEHFHRHEDTVTEWRETITEHFREQTAVAGPDGADCRFEVRYLGAGKQ
ncbi:hypothetical protein G9C85_00335 [Halorubellus sp. JP-L1]|uniref:hypothetical protein n=1 Tax=Halorubellus sp. JP-L1 TaxID=2715753 RepID=UPI00140B7964|nr:hypothetical protein [Halorubellus sp. JP-L1]NHN40086.1 hypothetical protein [Halorubellus sp. JP-L1]